jgi:hypothetical protein
MSKEEFLKFKEYLTHYLFLLLIYVIGITYYYEGLQVGANIDESYQITISYLWCVVPFISLAVVFLLLETLFENL